MDIHRVKQVIISMTNHQIQSVILHMSRNTDMLPGFSIIQDAEEFPNCCSSSMSKCRLESPTIIGQPVGRLQTSM